MIKKIIKRMLGRHLSPTRAARVWSNREIAKLSPLVQGAVINVSAWKDEDKEGSRYRDYFSNATSYSTSNYDGWRGTEGQTDYEIDLQRPIDDDFKRKFDLVYNHTTLEHIFEFQQAFRNMAEMSSDAMLTVVPFMQHLHGPEDGDFWRPSPYAMRRTFEANGFQVLYESAGPVGGKVRYLLHFAARDAEKWAGKLPEGSGAAEAILRERE